MDLWFLLLVISVYTKRVDGTPDTTGFVSIDCGLAASTTLVDSATGLTFVSDDQFIDTGVNNRVSAKYTSGSIYQKYLTLRSFPNGTRNCYTLRSLTIGAKYLVRATFMYGNYDNFNKPPVFDVHLGVNYWGTVTTTDNTTTSTEIIATTTSNYLQVCLVNQNIGTPFISTLELRPLQTNIYQIVNSTSSLIRYYRLNLGASDVLRYPDDPFDRVWVPFTWGTWANVSTNSTVKVDKYIGAPTPVMQTAVTSLSTNQSVYIPWDSDDASTSFWVVLHIAEIQDLPSTSRREFNVLANGKLALSSLVASTLTAPVSFVNTSLTEYVVSLEATSSSTLPPLLNAMELFVIRPTTAILTNGGDVNAIIAIKSNYKISKESWQGDPCAPTEFSWSGITCTNDSTNIPRITTLNLSSSGLTGAIIPSFGNLSALKSLDLSYNDLSGDLPASLDQLSALTYLDITGNSKISTTLPPSLNKRKQDGNLMFRTSAGENTKKDTKKKSIVIVVAAVVVVLLLIAAAITLFVCLRRSKKPSIGNNAGSNNESRSELNKTREGMLDFDNRRFTYNDIVRITKEFQNNIGVGGFGSVFAGVLENGTQVAVKMRSHSSSQGVKEFLAEAQNLTRVHHKNLVSLIGYCMDGDCMALVYQYMQQGTLQDKLMDNARPLSWKQRVRIAYESALGLEYLHKACNPPLIHRDVKTSNILLNENLEAKIADFGLSREFNSAASSHVSTAVVGTPGYLDPEYYSLYQLSEKSDVFSFGVVLLEIITGKPPIIPGSEGGHLKEWVNQKLSRGDIESIVDSKMQGKYDINSVWKVTELARKCTENSSAQRPTMRMVVAELKESLHLEISTEGTRGKNTSNYDPNNYSRNENFASDVSQNSVIEMAYMRDMGGPSPEAR